jgi:hypothetical protein
MVRNISRGTKRFDYEGQTLFFEGEGGLKFVAKDLINIPFGCG